MLSIINFLLLKLFWTCLGCLWLVVQKLSASLESKFHRQFSRWIGYEPVHGCSIGVPLNQEVTSYRVSKLFSHENDKIGSPRCRALHRRGHQIWSWRSVEHGPMHYLPLCRNRYYNSSFYVEIWALYNLYLTIAQSILKVLKSPSII